VIPDEVIVAGVLAMRFFVPLTILRYPLPGIIASLLADAVDGAIFSGFTDVTLENYQQYDKALDIYYLAIAYVATLRNWSDPFALRVGQFLWYCRLLGVALFAVFEERWLLFLFPATFEYFFIYYEAARTRWWPDRLSPRHLIAAAAALWVGIKLPQEYWVHVAQRSTTEWVKESIFGVDPSTTRLDAVAANPGAALAILAGLAVFVLAGWYAFRWLPRPDHPPVFDADTYGPGVRAGLVAGRRKVVEPILSWPLVEKIALVGLTCIVFSEFLPGVSASALQIAFAVAFVAVVNSAVSHWIARRGGTWRTTVLEFFAMSLINAGIVLGIVVLSRWTDASIDSVTTLFYLLLFTLLVTLYDRYRYLRRWGFVEESGTSGVREPSGVA
jgi:hypothetical protein